MPVLTKINTNSIAEDAITGDKFAGDAYLANTANQNISGTYSENRLYTSDAYTLSGNATVNSHLTLSSIKPTDDVVLTASGAYTITGTGVLSAGALLAPQPKQLDLTGMTGELGSAVTGGAGLSGSTSLGTVASGDVSAIQDGWVHILTKTNTSANSINITQADNATAFSSTYPLYMITMTNFSNLSATGTLEMRFEYNGAIPTSGYRYNVNDQRSTPGDYSVGNASSSSTIKLSYHDSRAAAYHQGSMIMYINDTHLNSRQGCWWQFSHMLTSNGNSVKSDGVGGYDPSSYPVTGVQFIATSSITWNATFKVFGLKG